MRESSVSTSRKRVAQFVFGLAAGLLLVCVVLEVLLHLLPVSTGIQRAEPATPHSSARLVPSDYTTSLGWDLRFVQHGKINQAGFPSAFDYDPSDRAIAIFGDSFAEGLMLPFDRSLAGNLYEALDKTARPYNFGLSDTALPHYLGMAREQGRNYRFDAAVVVVNENDYVEGLPSYQSNDGIYKWRDALDATGGDIITLRPAKRRSNDALAVLRNSALVKYLMHYLKVTRVTLLPDQLNPVCSAESLDDTDRMRLQRWVAEMPAALQLPPEQIVLVFTESIQALYRRVDGAAHRAAERNCVSKDQLALVYLRQLAVQAGLQLVDTDILLESQYLAKRRYLDLSPVDGHWNTETAALIAKEIASRLKNTSGNAYLAAQDAGEP